MPMSIARDPLVHRNLVVKNLDFGEEEEIPEDDSLVEEEEFWEDEDFYCEEEYPREFNQCRFASRL